MMSVVTVTPIYKTSLSSYEQAALMQLVKLVPEYPHVFIAPEGMDVGYYRAHFGKDFMFEFFDANYFKSPQTYNALLRSIKFFERFKKFSNLLMYHTDAWIFRNDLLRWAKKGYAYIGAPMYEYNGTMEGGQYICTGQGGFSMHHIPSAIKVLKSNVAVYSMSDLKKWYCQYNWKGKLRYGYYFLISCLGKNRSSKSGNNGIKVNEDVWWGKYVAGAFDWYSVPDEAEAAQFSMEFNCEKLLKQNKGQLPMGTHQWFKPLFKDFWGSYIK